MSHLPRFSPLPLIALAAVLGITGCPQSQNDSAANNQASTQDQGTDPAAANLVPASNQTNAASNDGQAPASPAYQQSAPPPSAGGANYQATDQGADDSGYGEQPVAYSQTPPPPLPDYE